MRIYMKALRSVHGGIPVISLHLEMRFIFLPGSVLASRNGTAKAKSIGDAGVDFVVKCGKDTVIEAAL